MDYPVQFQVVNDEEEQHHYVELTLDVREDSVTLRSISAVDHGSSKVADERAAAAAAAAVQRQRSAASSTLSSRLSRALSRSRNSTPNPDSRYLVRTRSGAEHALQGLRFISKTTNERKSSWEVVGARFDKLAGDDEMLARTDFGLCIGMQDSNEFAAELFDALARRRGLKLRKISKKDMYEFWLQISDQSFDARMQIFFDMCDKNLDGRISEEEVKEVIMLSASANKLSKLKEQAEEYAALIMEELDPENLGYIELWQLEALMLKGSGITSKDASSNCSQTLLRRHKRWLLKRCMSNISENWKRLWLLTLWGAIMASLFTWKFIQYKNKVAFEIMGYCVCIAKGAAETLKFNMAIILLPVCRNTITWLRSTWLSNIVPFNDDINFHKTVAIAIATGITLHAGFHLGCDFPKIVSLSETRFKQTIGRGWHERQPSYSDILASVEGVTGIIMVVFMGIVYILASRWFRRSQINLPWPFKNLTGYNTFWYSHHLLVIVYILLLVHSIFLFLAFSWDQKTTWMYLAVPLVLYAVERTYRACRAEYGNYTVQVLKAAIYPGNVLALYMGKPPGFRYKSGMYIYLKCSAISPFEWHPFSITSAPDDELLSVHIRTSGDWTQSMKRLFSEICEPGPDNRGELVEENVVSEGELPTSRRLPKMLIDGPYGAPAQDYKKYDVLLLIGLGIGATPFISILKDMLNQLKMADQQQDSSVSGSFNGRAAGTFGPDTSLRPSNLLPVENPRRQSLSLDNTPMRRLSLESPRRRRRRCPTNAYFYWVTREQGSFEWFKGVMNEVAELDHQAVIEMHNYLTSVYEEGDARSALIAMVQALHHAKRGVDIVSGTRVRTHFARPNWHKVFSGLANTHAGSTIGVFYCGPVVLSKELSALSQEFTEQTSCRFEFHKENF